MAKPKKKFRSTQSVEWETGATVDQVDTFSLLRVGILEDITIALSLSQILTFQG